MFSFDWAIASYPIFHDAIAQSPNKAVSQELYQQNEQPQAFNLKRNKILNAAAGVRYI